MQFVELLGDLTMISIASEEYDFNTLSIKVALVAGAVKLSIDNDIWSLSTTSGANLYQKLKQYIVPGTIVFPENLPSVEEVQSDVGRIWNSGVDKVLCQLRAHLAVSIL
ncbi:hypothetical protein OSTOST_10918 [Ostertagia ostertagi]